MKTIEGKGREMICNKTAFNNKTAAVAVKYLMLAMNALPAWRALFCSGMVVILAGCSSTKVSRVGDAYLRITHRCTTFDLLVGADYIYALEFPEVSLSERGEHVFHVRGLSTSVFPDSFLLLYPVFHPLSDSAYRPQWGDARVLIEFRDPTGTTLFSHTVDFATAKFSEDHANYTRPNFCYHLGGAVAEHLRGLTNYDAFVTVVTPTKRGKHFARLRGEGFTFGRIAQQDSAANGSQPICSETNRTSSAVGSRR